jgi:hypothetical protein
MFRRVTCSCVVLEPLRSCAPERHFRGADASGVRLSAEKQLMCSAELQQQCFQGDQNVGNRAQNGPKKCKMPRSTYKCLPKEKANLAEIFSNRSW